MPSAVRVTYASTSFCGLMFVVSLSAFYITINQITIGRCKWCPNLDEPGLHRRRGVLAGEPLSKLSSSQLASLPEVPHGVRCMRQFPPFPQTNLDERIPWLTDETSCPSPLVSRWLYQVLKPYPYAGKASHIRFRYQARLSFRWRSYT